ncbi:MAG TPA: SDR family oxidoreductase [Verrucomicrobiae bacterium]|nr:SDR family oxidoreductase [Verrucomicrobiae bacterium]
MPEYLDLKDKVVLLTGGANGIGAATVRAFEAQGARVFFCDLDKSAGQKLERELRNSRFSRVDLTNERQILRWIEQVRKAAPAIHILVNNAAIDPRIPLDELATDRLDEIYALNLRPYFICARECAPHMPAGQSSIVNLSSITFHTGAIRMSAYVATKAGIIGFTRSLARELGPKGIRVNTVSPGWVMTDRQLREYVDAEARRLIQGSQCIPDLLQPADLAEVILFLASDASRAVTGQEILADRGWAHS